jgi:hypothetical protein
MTVIPIYTCETCLRRTIDCPIGVGHLDNKDCYLIEQIGCAAHSDFVEPIVILDAWLGPNCLDCECDTTDDWYGYGYDDCRTAVQNMVKQLINNPQTVALRGRNERWLKR